MSNNSSIYINGVLQNPSTHTYNGKGFTQLTGKTTMSQHSINALNTINLNNISPGSAINNWLSDITASNIHPSIKQFEMYETPVDVLALSCVLQRMRNAREYGSKLLDSAVMSKLTGEDKEKAKSIRDFYSKKIMMGTLKENMQMTPFRKDLSAFILKDGLLFKKSDIGMICYLPDFYDYDVTMDLIKAQVQTSHDFKNLTMKGTPVTMGLTAVNLTPITKVTKNNKHSRQTEYWFKDDKLNAAVQFSIDPKNPLLMVWDDIFNSEKTLAVNGFFHRRMTDDFEYFSITNLKIEKG